MSSTVAFVTFHTKADGMDVSDLYGIYTTLERAVKAVNEFAGENGGQITDAEQGEDRAYFTVDSNGECTKFTIHVCDVQG